MAPTPPEITAHLDELRAVLLAERRRLFMQVARVEDDLQWLDEDVEPELVEEGQEASMALLLERLDERGRGEIQAIDSAVERIDRGDYGVCTNCQRPIPLARLRAMPTAELCLTCAKLREGEPVSR